MNASDRVAQIQASPELRRRIEAIVRRAWWANPDADPTAPIPVDALAWACAANPTVTAAVEAQEQVDGGVNAVPRGILTVPDSDLEHIVLNVALPRLTGNASA